MKKMVVLISLVMSSLSFAAAPSALEVAIAKEAVVQSLSSSENEVVKNVLLVDSDEDTIYLVAETSTKEVTEYKDEDGTVYVEELNIECEYFYEFVRGSEALEIVAGGCSEVK